MKYIKYLAILVLMFLIYKLFDYYYGNIYEGLTNKCSSYQNCGDCIKNYNDDKKSEQCRWSTYKKECGYGKGYESRGCIK